MNQRRFQVYFTFADLPSLSLRWWCSGDGGGPWEAGGLHWTPGVVPSWCALPPGSHAAFPGEHSPEAHITHRLHTPQHAQHFLWAVTAGYPNLTVYVDNIRAWPTVCLYFTQEQVRNLGLAFWEDRGCQRLRSQGKETADQIVALIVSGVKCIYYFSYFLSVKVILHYVLYISVCSSKVSHYNWPIGCIKLHMILYSSWLT